MRRLRLRVPKTDGSLLAVPDLDEWQRSLGDNRQSLPAMDVAIGGMALADLRRLARRELLTQSSEYLAGFGEPALSSVDLDFPMVVTGHQPTLFHPGVWIKNFAAYGLANALNGIGVNVLIDNDTVKQTAVPVPAGRPAAPLLAYAPFDRWAAEIPFEERDIVDEEVFTRFAGIVANHLAEYPFEPIAEHYWHLTKASAAVTANLGERLAAGRRALERQWGCHNAEVPLSHLCRGEAFARLASHVLLQLDAFVEHHNQALAEYRKLNRVQSRNHPVPALERDDEWTEAPLWAWSSGRPERKRLFVRRERGTMQLRVGDQLIATVDLAGDAAEELLELLGNDRLGVKLRPRALLTTMFLRLCVADLFIHGVGGGKYDELGDELINRFFRIRPPSFAILSATAMLPTEACLVDDQRLAEQSHLHRDLYWNPDRYLDDALRDQEPVADWIERKFELMEQTPDTRAGRRARFREFRQLGDQLRRYLGSLPLDVERERVGLIERQQAGEILNSREFAYCLFPAETLVKLFDKVRATQSTLRE